MLLFIFRKPNCHTAMKQPSCTLGAMVDWVHRYWQFVVALPASISYQPWHLRGEPHHVYTFVLDETAKGRADTHSNIGRMMFMPFERGQWYTCSFR